VAGLGHILKRRPKGTILAILKEGAGRGAAVHERKPKSGEFSWGGERTQSRLKKKKGRRKKISPQELGAGARVGAAKKRKFLGVHRGKGVDDAKSGKKKNSRVKGKNPTVVNNPLEEHVYRTHTKNSRERQWSKEASFLI